LAVTEDNGSGLIDS